MRKNYEWDNQFIYFVCVCVCNKVLLKYKGDRKSF